MKWFPLSVLAICALLSGIWSGEDTKSFLISNTGLGLIGVLIILAILVARGIAFRILACIATVAVFVAGYFIGDAESSDAYRESISKGEMVREALEHYRTRSGHYPNRLKELGVDLPGDRFLRGSILDYERTESGYEIVFSDWLVSHRATERQPFTAHK